MTPISELLATYPVAVWAVLALALGALEILSTAGFFLSFAVAAAAVAAAGWLGWLPESPYATFAMFAGIGVALVVPFRALLRRSTRDVPDINRY